MALSFLNPVALFLLLVLPILSYFFYDYKKKKKRAALKFSSLGIINKAKNKTKDNKLFDFNKKIFVRENLPFILLFLIVFMIIIAFADPHIPLEQEKEGVNVILVLDNSGSMSATDYSPNRLEAAKSSAKVLIENLKPKDNVGIVLFESGATTAAYLTPFKDRAIEKLMAVKQKQGRTAIGDGLALAVDMATSIPNKKKVIILLSDGVSNAGVIAPEEAMALAKSENIQVNTIGMGSDGKTVLGYDWFGRPQYAELDEATLKLIASYTDGDYFKSVDDDTLSEIYEKIADNIEREKEETSIKNWFFIAAFILLLVLIYLIYGKYRIVV